MAFASDSTSAPIRPLLPLTALPAPDRGAIGRDGWARARALAARLGGAVRDHLAEGLRQAWRAARAAGVDGAVVRDFRATDAAMGNPMTARAELPPVPLLSSAEAGIPVSARGWAVAADAPHGGMGVPKSGDTPFAPIEADTALPGSAAKGLGPDTAPEVTTLRAVHALHLRRRLEAAAEHGASLLAALGLPQLAALDDAIALLDALDGDPDIEDDDPAEAEPDEPCLGWPEDVAARLDAACAADPDAELDDADIEQDHRAPWFAAPDLSAIGEARA